MGDPHIYSGKAIFLDNLAETLTDLADRLNKFRNFTTFFNFVICNRVTSGS